MQFSVPQFTDVEDKIIGSLTVKQFGIIFAAGAIVFMAYSLTKSVAVLIVFAVLVGLPAAGIAFAKVNGRPMYVMFGFILKFVLSPKILVFHKQGVKNSAFSVKDKKEEVKAPVEAMEAPKNPQERLKEVNKLLAEKAREEEELLRHMK